jgi:hypothetical protein
MEGQCLSPPGYGGCPVSPYVGPEGYAGDAYTGFYGDDVMANLGDVIEVKTQSGPPNKGGSDTDPLIGDGSVEQYNASPTRRNRS